MMLIVFSRLCFNLTPCCGRDQLLTQFSDNFVIILCRMAKVLTEIINLAPKHQTGTLWMQSSPFIVFDLTLKDHKNKQRMLRNFVESQRLSQIQLKLLTVRLLSVCCHSSTSITTKTQTQLKSWVKHSNHQITTTHLKHHKLK